MRVRHLVARESTSAQSTSARRVTAMRDRARVRGVRRDAAASARESRRTSMSQATSLRSHELSAMRARAFALRVLRPPDCCFSVSDPLAVLSSVRYIASRETQRSVPSLLEAHRRGAFPSLDVGADSSRRRLPVPCPTEPQNQPCHGACTRLSQTSALDVPKLLSG